MLIIPLPVNYLACPHLQYFQFQNSQSYKAYIHKALIYMLD